MANLAEVSQWENVIRQIENGEAATGGADGLANVQAKQLANRTKWLKDNLAPIVNAAFSGTLKHGNNDLADAAIVAKSLGDNGYVKYASGLIIQWGATNIEPYDGQKIYSGLAYPIVFPDRVCSMTVSKGWPQSNKPCIVEVEPYKNDFKLTVWNFTSTQYTSGEIKWIAIGY